MPFEISGPLHFAVQEVVGCNSDRVINLPEGSASLQHSLMARKTGAVEPLKVVAARRGFGNLELSYLRTYAVYLGVPERVTMVECMEELVKASLPDCCLICCRSLL